MSLAEAQAAVDSASQAEHDEGSVKLVVPAENQSRYFAGLIGLPLIFSIPALGIGIWVWREQFHLYRLPGRHLVKSDAKVATRAPRSWPILTACVAAVVGVGLASVAIRWLATTTAAGMHPRSASLDISWPVLALGGMVALAAAALVTQRRLWGEGSPGASSGAGRTMQGTWRGAIPVCALALSTCLAIWGGQLLHRTWLATSTSPGFDEHRVAALHLRPARDATGVETWWPPLRQELLSRVSSLSDVEASAQAGLSLFSPPVGRLSCEPCHKQEWSRRQVCGP